MRVCLYTSAHMCHAIQVKIRGQLSQIHYYPSTCVSRALPHVFRPNRQRLYPLSRLTGLSVKFKIDTSISPFFVHGSHMAWNPLCLWLEAASEMVKYRESGGFPEGKGLKESRACRPILTVWILHYLFQQIPWTRSICHIQRQHWSFRTDLPSLRCQLSSPARCGQRMPLYNHRSPTQFHSDFFSVPFKRKWASKERPPLVPWQL